MVYIHSDHLGTPQKMTDASKVVTWDRVQDPFGNTHSLSGAAQNPLRFPGQYADEESALAYNYFRDYDPTLGRYVQSDPIGLFGGLNTFAYVSGNPIIFYDPTGLLNPVKLLTCNLTSLNAGRLYASGAAKIAAGTLTEGTVVGVRAGVGLTAWGSVNLYGGYKAHEKADQLCDEAIQEEWSDACWKNLWGLDPGGTSFDDFNEPTWLEKITNVDDAHISDVLNELSQYLP